MEAEAVFTLSAWRDAMTHAEQPCPLCHDAVGFHHESYIPIELACGHIICCECLGLAFERQIDTEFRCRCPLCPNGFIYAIHPDRTKTAVTHFRYDWMGQFIEPQQTVRRSGRRRALTERGRNWQEEIAKRRTRRP